MPTHYKDKSRNPSQPKPEGKPYRLFGADDNGQTYFYWSTTPAGYAGYYGRDPKKAVWGTLSCKNTMSIDRLVFIEDLAMVSKLEQNGIMRPCGNCMREEYKIWKASQAQDEDYEEPLDQETEMRLLEKRLAYSPSRARQMAKKVAFVQDNPDLVSAIELDDEDIEILDEIWDEEGDRLQKELGDQKVNTEMEEKILELMSDDRFNLQRFIKAQEERFPYADALAEIRAGKKVGHWMWFIFPQIAGLGKTDTSKFYAISSLEEALAHHIHPVLGERLIECSDAVFRLRGKTAREIFRDDDDVKLRSSMTLFSAIPGAHSIFDCVLGRYFDGERDEVTIQIIEDQEKQGLSKS